jgi:hypothetical protein
MAADRDWVLGFLEQARADLAAVRVLISHHAFTTEQASVLAMLLRWHLTPGLPARPARASLFWCLPEDQAQDIFGFWENARRGNAARVAVRDGWLVNGIVEAPIAVYRHNTRPREHHYLIVQHGSHQCVPVEEQPDIEAGYVLLHRGIGDANVFHFPVQHRVRGTPKLDSEWALWGAAHQSFALRSWVSGHKFGSNRVVCRTPLTNIRITTFFAGEHDVRIIDPDRVEIVAAIGCSVKQGR